MKPIIVMVVGFVISAAGVAMSATMQLAPVTSIVGGTTMHYLGDALPLLGAVLFSLGVLLLAIERPRPHDSSGVLIAGIFGLVVALVLLLVVPPTSLWLPTLSRSTVPFHTQVLANAFIAAMTPIGLTLIATALALRSIRAAREL
jgi:hypothetical protein